MQLARSWHLGKGTLNCLAGEQCLPCVQQLLGGEVSVGPLPWWEMQGHCVRCVSPGKQDGFIVLCRAEVDLAPLGHMLFYSLVC